MNSKTIYGIVAAIVMAAGFIAVQPLQQAQAVHTTILAATSQVRTVAATAFNIADAGVAKTLTCNAPFTLLELHVVGTNPGAAVDAVTFDQVNFDGAAATYAAVAPTGGSISASAASIATAGGATISIAALGTVSAGTDGTMRVSFTEGNAGDADATNISAVVLTTNSATCSIT